MANFKKVNSAAKKAFPQLDVEVVRGYGYIYFVGKDGENMESIFAHPVTTSTEDVIEMVLSELGDYE